MTTHRRTECKHCLDYYFFQGSGWNAPKFNDSEYCPTCKEAIVTALNNIPKKYEYIWIDTNDFTFKEAIDIIEEDEQKLIEKEKLRESRAKKCNGCDLISPFDGLFSARRVSMPLFNLVTGETSVGNFFNRNEIDYVLSYFKSDPENYKLRKKIKKEIII